MIFLLLAALATGWAMLDAFICRHIFRSVKNRWLSITFIAILFPLFLIFPLSDELIAKRKFDKLCASEEAAFKPLIVNAENRDLKQIYGLPSGLITDEPLEIYFSEDAYADLATGEELIRYKSYRVVGGRLIRFLGVSNSNSPLTIGLSSCSPKAIEPILRSFRFLKK
jgi:hypothetical protein